MNTIITFVWILFYAYSADSVVHPCFGVPDDSKPWLVLCQGSDIQQLPNFSVEEKWHIQSLILYNTFIYSLPAMNETEYENMEVFEEYDNIIFNCTYLDNWRQYQSETTFSTECPTGSVAATAATSTTPSGENGAPTLTTEEGGEWGSTLLTMMTSTGVESGSPSVSEMVTVLTPTTLIMTDLTNDPPIITISDTVSMPTTIATTGSGDTPEVISSTRFMSTFDSSESNVDPTVTPVSPCGLRMTDPLAIFSIICIIFTSAVVTYVMLYYLFGKTGCVAVMRGKYVRHRLARSMKRRHQFITRELILQRNFNSVQNPIYRETTRPNLNSNDVIELSPIKNPSSSAVRRQTDAMKSPPTRALTVGMLV